MLIVLMMTLLVFAVAVGTRVFNAGHSTDGRDRLLASIMAGVFSAIPVFLAVLALALFVQPAGAEEKQVVFDEEIVKFSEDASAKGSYHMDFADGTSKDIVKTSVELVMTGERGEAPRFVEEAYHNPIGGWDVCTYKLVMPAGLEAEDAGEE